MEKYDDILHQVDLFRKIPTEDLTSMLTCLAAETVNYKKNEIILLAGNKPEYVGILLSGTVRIVKEDYEGNRTIMAALEPGDFFAEALCCAGVEESPVTVTADTDSAVMLLNFPRILHVCPNSCIFHQKLIENMLGIIARKNLFLQNRMGIVRIKSIRKKVLRYLKSFAQKQGRIITVPLNREEMADYLFVDRSALSHELIKMKQDGLIDYKKNIFILNTD